MSRSTQIMGLSPRAHRFLDKHGVTMPLVTCKTCGHSTGGAAVCEVYDTESGVAAGMFDDGPELRKWELQSGEWAKEVVQEVPWSSGPVIFLTLELQDGTRIGDWTEEEIQEAL